MWVLMEESFTASLGVLRKQPNWYVHFAMGAA